MFAMGHTVCSKLGNTIKRTIKFLKDEGAAGEFALATTDGILLKASENMYKGVGGGVKDLIHNSNVIIETVRAEYMAKLETELENLRLLYDNKVKDVERFGNKYLKPQYKHILGIDLIFGREGMLSKVSGFHHDFMNALEKSGIVEFANKVVYDNGFYKAVLLHNGKVVKQVATFFPSHWSRQKVIETIYEAYGNFLKSGVAAELKKGKFLVKGLTNDGVTIEMYLTQSGQIVTAYPLL